MSDQEKIILRLKRIEGQVRGVQKMIKEDCDCREVLQQLSAARAALFKVGMLYFSRSLDKCLKIEEKCSEEALREIETFIESMSKFV